MSALLYHVQPLLSTNAAENYLGIAGSPTDENLKEVAAEISRRLKEDGRFEPNADAPQIVLLLAPAGDIRKEVIDALAEKTRERVIQAIESKPGKGAAAENSRHLVPVLTVGLIDWMDDYRPRIKNGKNTIQNLSMGNPYARHGDFDPRYRFLNSNIWFRYAPVIFPKHAPDNDGLDAVRYALKEVSRFYREGAYDTKVAHEFLELQLRLLLQSHLRVGSTHSKVVPFAFYSDTILYSEALKELRYLEGIKWRILIVDDQAEEAIERLETTCPSPENAIQSEGQPDAMSKRQFVQKHLEAIVQDANGTTREIQSDNFLWCCRSTLAEGFEAVVNQPEIHYDVIMLDYFFKGERSGRQNQSGFSDDKSGEQLIAEIVQQLRKKDTDSRQLLGPLNKLFFFSISAYGSALEEKLQHLAIPQNDRKWLFSQGGHPICTPYLFLFRFFSLLRQQVEEVAEIDLSKAGSAPQSKLAILLKKLTSDGNFDPQKALDLFPSFVELGATFKRLSNFRKQSVFADSALNRYFFGLTIEHWNRLQHLIYLLTYGTEQEYWEMREEWKHLNQLAEFSAGNNHALNVIGTYIADLNIRS